MKDAIIRFTVFVVMFILFWNVSDFIIQTFITKAGFMFTVQKGIVEPLLPALICGAILYLLPVLKRK